MPKKTTLLTPRQKLATARLWACNKMPYFTVGLHSFIVVETNTEPLVGFPTLAVTKDAKLLVDMRYVANSTVESLGSMLIHELMHLLRDHLNTAKTVGISAKSPHKQRMLWNLAVDAEINDDLVEAGLAMWSGFVVAGDEKYYLDGAETGWTWQRYYQHILDKVAEEPDGEPEVPEGWAPCGSGAGAPFPGEPEELDTKAGEGEDGGINMSGGRSEADLEGIRAQTAEAVQKHERSNGSGSVPGGLSRWAETVLQPPHVDWRSELARSTRNAIAFRPGAVDYRYDRPSRRQGGMGYGVGIPILPALRMPVPRVGLGVDTSGSMGPGELGVALSEGAHVLLSAGADVDYIVCDARVDGVHKVRSVSDMKELLRGGGGTDFRPVFRALDEMPNPPEVFIFVTDGVGPAPVHPPQCGATVIWLLVGPYRRVPWAAPDGVGWGDSGDSVTWGKVIEVDDVGQEDS